jgi:SanA protein
MQVRGRLQIARIDSTASVSAAPRALVAEGVPSGDVFTDHAGFDTWSSIVRARKVFDVGSALIVTQGFHMPRAL